MSISRRLALTAIAANALTATALATALHYGLTGTAPRAGTVHPAPVAGRGDFVWPAAAPADFVWPGTAGTPPPAPATAPKAGLAPADFVWPGTASTPPPAPSPTPAPPAA